MKATAVLLWGTYALLWAGGLALVLEIALRGFGFWIIFATLVADTFLFLMIHVTREIHLDGRLPRIGDWKHGAQNVGHESAEDDWEASH